jgi:DegV family protein with EDD domain
MNIRFVTDSASDIDWKFAKKNKIKVIPLKVTYHNKTFLEDEDFDFRKYYQQFKEDEDFKPKTSQPSPLQYVKAYQELIKEGAKEIIVITISSGLSGTYNSATLAAKKIFETNPEIKIHIVDSRNASYPEVFILERGMELEKEGLEAGEIAERLRKYRELVRTFIYLDSLEFLHRGGRISLTKYWLAKLLRKKVIITVNKEGKNEAYTTVRSREEGLEKLIEAGTEEYTKFPRKVAIVHSDLSEKAKELKEMVKEKIPNADRREVLTGTSISAHTGPYAIALIVDHGEKGIKEEKNK